MNLALPTSNRHALSILWRLGGPVTMQALLAATLGLIDTLMVSGVGTAALGGVGIVSRVLFVLAMVLNGLSSGAGVLVAQYSGAGRLRAARGPVAIAVSLGVTLTLPITLVSLFAADSMSRLLSPDPMVASAAATFLHWSALYGPLTAITLTLSATLRSSGNSRTPMWAGGAGLVLNTVLNFLFISGHLGMPAFGVAAAAAATIFGRLVEMLWLLAVLKPGPLQRLHTGIRRRDTWLVLGSVGPLMFKEIAWAGGVLASALIISRMGAMPLAAYNLVIPVEGIMISVVVGCGTATGILLGHALGRGAFDAAFDGAKRLLRLVSVNALVVGLFFAVFVQALRQSGWLFTVIAPELHDLALNSLSIICIALGAKAHNTMVSVGILRSGNDSKWLMWIDLCSMWLVSVPLVALAGLYFHWSLPQVVAIMTLEEILKVPVFRRRVKTGKWLQRI